MTAPRYTRACRTADALPKPAPTAPAVSTGITRIATLDVADFSVYRLQGRTRFELALLT